MGKMSNTYTKVAMRLALWVNIHDTFNIGTLCVFFEPTVPYTKAQFCQHSYSRSTIKWPAHQLLNFSRCNGLREFFKIHLHKCTIVSIVMWGGFRGLFLSNPAHSQTRSAEFRWAMAWSSFLTYQTPFFNWHDIIRSNLVVPQNYLNQPIKTSWKRNRTESKSKELINNRSPNPLSCASPQQNKPFLIYLWISNCMTISRDKLAISHHIECLTEDGRIRTYDLQFDLPLRLTV